MENLTYISKYMTVIAGHSKSGFQAFTCGHSKYRLRLNNKEMQAWTQSVSDWRAITVVNFRFTVSSGNTDGIFDFYPNVVVVRIVPALRNEERALRLSVCWQSRSRVRSAHYQQRARVFYH